MGVLEMNKQAEMKWNEDQKREAQEQAAFIKGSEYTNGTCNSWNWQSQTRLKATEQPISYKHKEISNIIRRK